VTVTTSAVRVPGISAISSVAAGRRHTCALSIADELFCWGSNDKGQLGIGTANDVSQPTQVVLPGRVLTVRAASNSSCAILVDGEVWCWGDNRFGQVGNGRHGDDEIQATPYRVSLERPAHDLRVSAGRTCALAEGRMYCWGKRMESERESGFMTESDECQACKTNCELIATTDEDADVCRRACQETEGVCKVSPLVSSTPLEFSELPRKPHAFVTGPYIGECLIAGSERNIHCLADDSSTDTQLWNGLDELHDLRAAFRATLHACAVLNTDELRCFGLPASFGREPAPSHWWLESDDFFIENWQQEWLSVPGVSEQIIDIASTGNTSCVLQNPTRPVTMCWGPQGLPAEAITIETFRPETIADF
jgi:hypothetical protein